MVTERFTEKIELVCSRCTVAKRNKGTRGIDVLKCSGDFQGTLLAVEVDVLKG